jgi:hypothetical protein
MVSVIGLKIHVNTFWNKFIFVGLLRNLQLGLDGLDLWV